MIDINKVRNNVKVLGGFEDEIIEKYSFIISNAVSSVSSSLKCKDYETDTRIIFFASARAYYQISLAENNADGITSFSAVDLKIQKSSDYVSSVKSIYESAKEDCIALLNDTDFAFLGV